MNKPKSYTVDEVNNSVWIGFEIAFKTAKSTEFLIEDLSKILVSNVVFTTDTHKSPSINHLLCIEYKAKYSKYILKINYTNYVSIKNRILSLVEYLKNIGKIDNDSYMRVNMFYDHTTLKTVKKISSLHKINYLLNFDEQYVYNLVGEYVSPNALNVKNILPLQGVLISKNAVITDNLFEIPSGDYYKIDISQYAYNKLSFNYIGGEKWVDIPANVISVIEYYIIYTYQHINKILPSNDEYAKINEFKRRFTSVSSILASPSNFLDDQNSKLLISVDLSSNVETLKTMWYRIYRNLFYLQYNNNVTSGYFNYDSEFYRYQLKQAKISDGVLVDYDIVGCEISNCILINCNVIDSIVNNSRVTNSIATSCTKFNNCMMINNEIEAGCEIHNTTYINTLDKVFVGDAYSSVVKFCDISMLANIDSDSIVLNKRTLQSMYADAGLDKDMGFHVSIT